MTSGGDSKETSRARDRTCSTELIRMENEVIAAVPEAQRCRRCRESCSVEVLPVLGGTARYVKMEFVEMRTVMTRAV